MSKPLIRIDDAGSIGMVTLRCDLSDAKLSSALAFSGLELPERRRTTGSLQKGALWMSPNELMILTAHDEAEAMVGALSDGLTETHHLVVNVSDARAVFRLSGGNQVLRDVLAKLVPADLRPASLPIGEIRRTRIGQVPTAFWFTGEGEVILIVFRSVAGYVADLLHRVSQAGSEVGYF